jgi:DNA (cytosine-5)-methyltransferase 1
MMSSYTFLEFFAGGGMARLGLGDGWRCLFANDIDEQKASVYQMNFQPAKELLTRDVRFVSVKDIPGKANLAWGSFPCQDLSLAGNGLGLRGSRSGMFWEFWRVMRELKQEKRHPELIAIENVYGALTSNGGRDFNALIEIMIDDGYRVGALIVDAALFVPQSRPRLFVIAARNDRALPSSLIRSGPDARIHPPRMIERVASLQPSALPGWIWWRLPPPPPMRETLLNLIESDPVDVKWNSQAQTDRLLDMMAPMHRERVRVASEARKRTVGAIYKRTRVDAHGKKVQRAEIRLDGLAGCLRTPAGGSSRQIVMLINGSEIQSRLLSARETARLMGLPDTYRLPDDYNSAYHVAGDGVVSPVVRFLAAHIFEPYLALQTHQPPSFDDVSAFQLPLESAV